MRTILQKQAATRDSKRDSIKRNKQGRKYCNKPPPKERIVSIFRSNEVKINFGQHIAEKLHETYEQI